MILDQFAQHVHDLLQDFAPIKIRKMFGGYGVYAHGMMIALIADNILYFKANKQAAEYFKQQNSHPFTYETKQGKAATMPYWKAPDDLADDYQELKKWFTLALKAALERKDAKLSQKTS